MGTILQLNSEAKFISDPRKQVHDVYDEYKKIFHLSCNLVESKNVEIILKRFNQLLYEIVDFSALGLLLKEKYTDDFYLYYENEIDNNLSKRIRWLERTGYLEWVCKEGRVSIIPSESPEKSNQSMVLVPLLSGKQALGVLVIFLKLESNDLTSRLSDLLFLMGTQAALALENAYLYQDMDLKNQAMNNMKSFLENSLESMADGFFAIDLDDKISLFNTGAVKFLGVTSVQAIGNDYHRIFQDEFTNYLGQSLKTTHRMGSFEGEFEYQNPLDGKNYPLGLHVSILKNEEKVDIGSIVICRDLTERQEIIHLKKLDKMKDEFISSVSHELRTPLTGIKSFTEILLQYDDQDVEAQREFLSIIEKETNRLIEIVNDLLDIGRMSQGDFEIKHDRVDVQEVLNESLTLLSILATSKNVGIKTNLDVNHLQIDGDFNRLIQVFVNLIGNAIKFSSEGKEVSVLSKPIEGKRRMDQGNYLQIAVKDSGIGIPKEYQKVIFEKFKQFSYDTATKPDGSGLGLSICKKIVKKSGGNIWVESRENQGSTFYFTLPLAESKIEKAVDELV